MTVKVAIETYGCTTNQADSDIMRGLISRHFELSSVESADVVVVNSCGVIDFTERKIIRRMVELKNRGKKVVLAGCLTRISREALELADSAISPDNLDMVVDAVHSALNGRRFYTERRFIDKAELSSLTNNLCHYSARAVANRMVISGFNNSIIGYSLRRLI